MYGNGQWFSITEFLKTFTGENVQTLKCSFCEKRLGWIVWKSPIQFGLQYVSVHMSLIILN